MLDVLKVIGICMVAGFCLAVGSYCAPLGFILLYLTGLLDM